MAPSPLHVFKKETGFAQENQPQILVCGFLVAGGAFLLLVLLMFLCNNCQSRNNKEKKVKIDGVKLVGMSVGHMHQLRPVNTPELGVRNLSRMSHHGENGLRSWSASMDYLHPLGTEHLEEGASEERNSRIQQPRELPRLPENNCEGGKLPALRNTTDMDCIYANAERYPCQENSVEDSLYESVGTNHEVDHNNLQSVRQSKLEYRANEIGASLTPQRPLTQRFQESPRNMDAPEYASIRRMKKKERLPNLEGVQEQQPRTNVKKGNVMLPGPRNYGKQLRIEEKSTLLQTENHSSAIQGSLKSITEYEATKSLKECREERIPCANLTEGRPNADSACFKGKGYSFNKSHEQLHSLTDEEIAAMYSKVVKKGPRKEIALSLNTGLQKGGKLNHHFWSTGNLNEEESEYESIKSPRWHSGNQITGDESDYASVNERIWEMKFRNEVGGRDEEEEEEEEPDPGYEAINMKWKKINFAIKSGKIHKIAHEAQTENYYESINELQQSCTRTRVLTSADGKEVYITGL
ncbi:phosphoprotein associated with glycosphingolipid-enriched microdomains 1-like [Stegostoma tigrinum]|uniref:phosphoprotein associated with glycosphingolipid-enriched microdomains 1-like n=1 Tax=Stegostoma tigrinum TaxID=3053191 RepID=UPI00202B7875|nr:phosphoprotein associated with glycosphingolipid-enriched microdomains 1-like [Stegostoma tigrinum]